jgi:Protein of unknown function (DUF1360)
MAAGRYSPDEDQPLAGYAAVLATFATLTGAFGLWFRRSGRKLPDRIAASDLALLTVASHKVARVLAKDRVTTPLRAPFTELQGPAGPGEVDERPRGSGLRLVLGDLLVCPFCLGMWTSAALTAGLLIAPRATRWAATVMTMFFGSELLQIAYRRAEDALG